MRAALDDTPAIHDEDLIRIDDRAQAMGDHDPRAPERRQVFLDFGLGADVEVHADAITATLLVP